MTGLADADREYLKATCEASGVPVFITDPVVIARAAGLLNGETPSEGHQAKTGFHQGRTSSVEKDEN